MLRWRSLDLELSRTWIVADDGFSVGREPHVEFEAITAVRQGPVERGQSIFRDRLKGTGAAVAEQERATGGRGRHGRALLEIEISNWLARVRSLFRFLQRFLKFLLQE